MKLGKSAVVKYSKKVKYRSDNLNTHQSELLVRLVAGLEGKPVELGKKGNRGILQSIATRVFERFHYTPKHSSWRNQVERWFSILVRKVLKRGSFESVEALREKIWSFIEYYNLEWSKLFKWTYEGKPLQASSTRLFQPCCTS